MCCGETDRRYSLGWNLAQDEEGCPTNYNHVYRAAQYCVVAAYCDPYKHTPTWQLENRLQQNHTQKCL